MACSGVNFNLYRIYVCVCLIEGRFCDVVLVLRVSL